MTMLNVSILIVIAVSVSAQFIPDQRSYEGENLKINNGEPRVNPEFWEEGQRDHRRHMHRRPENPGAGGFQNGNFAQTDGKLRTNLDSNPPDYPSQNFQQRFDSPYVVEEGAAFRRQDNGQVDMHSKQGRINQDVYSAPEDRNFEERRQSQSLEQVPINQNANDQMYIERGQHPDEQVDTRRLNNNQNNQQRNSQDKGQTYPQNIYNVQNDQNTAVNAQRDDTNNQKTKQTTTLRNQPNKNQNIGASFNQNEKPVIYSATNSTSQMTKTEREAKDKEINNQISKMIFDASVQEVTTKRNTKTKDKVEPARNSMGTKDDRWIWNVTTSTVDPVVDDRAAFVGDQCPTNQVRFNNVCVDED